jgi:hypothetical protein
MFLDAPPVQSALTPRRISTPWDRRSGWSGGFMQRSQIAGIYRITGTLPPRGELPQYRIRNDSERHERVATQDNLEPVNISSGSEGATLIERTFGRG